MLLCFKSIPLITTHGVNCNFGLAYSKFLEIYFCKRKKRKKKKIIVLQCIFFLIFENHFQNMQYIFQINFQIAICNFFKTEKIFPEVPIRGFINYSAFLQVVLELCFKNYLNYNLFSND